MLILTDDNADKFEILGEDISEVSQNSVSLENLKIIENEFFLSSTPKFYKRNKSSYWTHLFLNGFSNKSQFDTINRLVSNNVELPNRLACFAESGEKFHGFRNRSWSAHKGNIHLSIYFIPRNTDQYFHAGLLILAAVSVLQTIDSIPELKGLAKTKWVNDIVINHSKVCGIISQSFSTGNKITGAVLGIGLNVNTEPSFTLDNFTTSAKSLSKLSGVDQLEISKILGNLLNNLANSIQLLENGKYLDLLNIYCDRSEVIGKEIEIYTDPISGESKLLEKGKVIGINKNLELILENPSRIVKSGRLALIK